MFKLDDNLLRELGLGALPAHEKNRMLSHIYETLEMRVGMKLAEQMTNEQLDEFEAFIDRNDEAGALKWLETNFPNYKQVVADQLENLKSEIKAAAPQIVAASQQAAMQAPPQYQYPPQGSMPQAPQQPAPQMQQPMPATPPQPMPQPQQAPQQQYPAPPPIPTPQTDMSNGQGMQSQQQADQTSGTSAQDDFSSPQDQSQPPLAA